MLLGPSQRATRSGSVQARKTFSGGASNSRVIRTVGSWGSASICASRLPVVVVVLMMLLPPDRQRCAGGLSILPRPWLRERRRGGGTAPRPAGGTSRSTWSSGRTPRPPGDEDAAGHPGCDSPARRLPARGDASRRPALRLHTAGRAGLPWRHQSPAARPCPAGSDRPMPQRSATADLLTSIASVFNQMVVKTVILPPIEC